MEQECVLLHPHSLLSQQWHDRSNGIFIQDDSNVSPWRPSGAPGTSGRAQNFLLRRFWPSRKRCWCLAKWKLFQELKTPQACDGKSFEVNGSLFVHFSELWIRPRQEPDVKAKKQWPSLQGNDKLGLCECRTSEFPEALSSMADSLCKSTDFSVESPSTRCAQLSWQGTHSRWHHNL